MTNDTRKDAAPALAVDEGSASAALAIAALERLASQHIESARRLYAQDWKYTYAADHMREAKRITDQIAAHATAQN